LIPKVVAIVYDAGSGIRFCFLKAFIDDVAVTSVSKSSSSVVVLHCNASAGTCIPKVNSNMLMLLLLSSCHSLHMNEYMHVCRDDTSFFLMGTV
jgi:hypothetical protein